MLPTDQSQPISDDEEIFRKIPVSPGWYDPESGGLSPKAFNPRPNDTGGLSVDRAKYRTVEEAAQGQSTRGYYVAVLQVGDLRKSGIDVEPRPVEGNPGHAEIPALTYESRKTDRSREIIQLVTQLVTRVEGPFTRQT